MIPTERIACMKKAQGKGENVLETERSILRLKWEGVMNGLKAEEVNRACF